MPRHFPLALAVLGSLSISALGQVIFTGRLQQPRGPDASEQLPLSAILCFASRDGSDAQPASFRTWETHPAGWYRLAGPAGNYTLVLSTPAHFMRPLVLTNQRLEPGQTLDRPLSPRADYAVFSEAAWDPKAATDYYQPFIARGASLTNVGFRLVHDGVDGAGPGKQDLLVSLHRRGDDPAATPDRWEQVGPAVPVIGVDSGGGKNYLWAAGWNSGEAPLEPGRTYAIHLRAEAPSGAFQAFWRPAADKPLDCYRRGGGTAGFTGQQLWMSIGTDGDGLVIPYHKRVQKEFGQLTRFAPKWAQTYVARGRGLAGVIFYAATSGVQPALSRQRVLVRVRRGGPDGPQVGREKIAIGNGNYTGDASWGVFGAAFAPGEVPLQPGQTYALEWESLESHHTLSGFVNIKGQPSDNKPGFNPYRKHPRDSYEPGAAYYLGKEAVDYDLDLQVIEYEHAATNWADAVAPGNLLRNGDMDAGEFDANDPARGKPADWQRFAADPATVHHYLADAPEAKNRLLRVVGGGATGKPADGGYVQKVTGLSRFETYRLTGSVRCSWAVDDQSRCEVGYDSTGQTDDPQAATILWTVLPEVHGRFVPYRSMPIRPAKDAVSVWLRARTSRKDGYPFRADFDDFGLRQVRSGAPTR